MVRSYMYKLDKDGQLTNVIEIKAKCDNCRARFTCTIETTRSAGDEQLQKEIEDIARRCRRCFGQCRIFK